MSESSIPGHFSREATPRAEFIRLRVVLVLVSLSTLTVEATDPQTSQGIATPKSFEPFLREHCYRHHGAETQEADLALHNMTRVITDSADVINWQDTPASGRRVRYQLPAERKSKAAARSSSVASGSINSQREENAEHSLRTQRAFQASHESHFRRSDLLSLVNRHLHTNLQPVAKQDL
jgi:hypothetical protein